MKANQDGGEKNPLIGAVFMLISITLFAVMDAFIKWLGADYPVQELMFFRCTVALIMVTVLLMKLGGFSLLRTTRPGLHLTRSVFGLLAMACAFYGFAVMPLAEASSIFYTAPLLATAFSVPILGERVGLHRWSCVVFGLLGVLIIIRPGTDVFSQGGVFMLVASIMVALTANIIRLLNRVNEAICITFYFALSGAVVSTLACLYFGWIVPRTEHWFGLIGIGVLGGGAQYALTLSLRIGEVGLISPLKYLAIIIGALVGYIVWAEIPDNTTFIGMAVILASGFYSVYRESRHRHHP